MNHIGVGKSPLATRNRLRYIPPSLSRGSAQITYGFTAESDDSSDSLNRAAATGYSNTSSSDSSSVSVLNTEGILTLLSTTYSLLVLYFFKSLVDRLRPGMQPKSRKSSMLNLFRLSTEAPEQVSECADASAVPQVEPANTTANTPLDGASAAWTAQKSPDVLPRELVGPSMSQNNYSNLYESMFEVDSDDEVIDLNAQYGTSLRISEDSQYTPNTANYERASDWRDASVYVGHSPDHMEPYTGAASALDKLNSTTYFASRKPGLFGTASFTLPADDMLDGIDLSAADEYDKAVSKFYMPLKPVPRKPFSLTEVIMASIPAPSLTSFLRRERAHIQDLILNERKAKLARITPLPPQQLQVVNRYWQMRQASAPVVSAYSIDITVRDLSTLADGRWLNDNVIDFYLNMVAERYPDVYCWTTHFFTTLKSKGYAGVARWAKRRKVTLTDKKLIAVPINIMSTHWAMAVVDNEAETISYYDSLASKGNLNAVQLLQHYMAKECERLQVAPVWYTLQPHMETPQQLNGFDCGVFSCSVAKFVCGRMALSFSQSDMATLRRRMAFEIILKSLLEDTPRAHL